MTFKKILAFTFLLAIISLSTVACSNASVEETTEETTEEAPTVIQTETETETETETQTVATIEENLYINNQYGFDFKLPESWKDYLVIEETWTGTSSELESTGPTIVLRHPSWTATKQRQDIPILVFTLEQWQDILAEKYNVSAAPIPPTLLGENDRYVFALPPRYNFAFLDGYEEVEAILLDVPLSVYDITE